jgi:hypothetical protein
MARLLLPTAVGPTMATSEPILSVFYPCGLLNDADEVIGFEAGATY